MRTFLTTLVCIAIAHTALAVSTSAIAEQRSIRDIPVAREALLRTVSPKFYRSLLISPVDGWIVVRGNLVRDHLVATRIMHSELNGEFDALALELANNLHTTGFFTIDSQAPTKPVLLHLLIYHVADGRMALSFAHFDEAGGSQMRYYGSAWMAVLKDNGQWVTIEPRRLLRHERRGPRTYTLAVQRAAAPDVSRLYQIR